jgi:kexin
MLLLLVILSLCSATRWTIPTHLEDSVSLEGFRIVTRVAGFTVLDLQHNRTRSAPSQFQVSEKRRQHTRYYRNGATDPLYQSQWHLFAIGTTEQATGKGITVAIVDDGLERNHPDLRSNYAGDLSHNFNSGNPSDPSPYRSDGHGTSAAGVCCAARNNICGRGVAYEASVVGIRLIADSVYDYEEATALTFKSDKIRIYSCSWGPADDGMDMVAPGPVLQAALALNYEATIYIWAGGNGRDVMDSSNYDGYANSPYVLAIGSVNHENQQAYYSESGANLMGVTPSSGAGRGITTTDLTGADGYSNGECTSSFGGTSSSAPLAAGIIALMLQIRPELRTRDVQHIIAKYASKSPVGGSWSVPNVRGYTHSNEFGFGLLKVPDLLSATTSWQRVGPLKRFKAQQVQVNRVIPIVAPIISPADLGFIERVLVTVYMSHGRRGQVNVSIRSSYATSILASHRGDMHSGTSAWTYSTLRHWGEELKKGDVWTVEVGDDTPDGYVGSVQGVVVEWMGNSSPP